MEKRKPGRPKSKEPIKDKRLSVKITEKMLTDCQQICIKHNITYVDIIEKGLEYWSKKQ